MEIDKYMSEEHHMHINWEEHQKDPSVCIRDASLEDKAYIISRVGIMELAVGAGAWRVLDAMNILSRALDVKCSADIGLCSLSCSFTGGGEVFTQQLTIPTTGINTAKMEKLIPCIRKMAEHPESVSVAQAHEMLEKVSKARGLYTPLQVGLASGVACFGFTFLLGGGFIEMIGALIGAFVGNFSRRLMIDRRMSLVANVICSVGLDCLATILYYRVIEGLFGVSPENEAGYICAMLFIIPGFPLINGGFDLAKSHMRSGIERLVYALMIITVATFTGWLTAYALSFSPGDFVALNLGLLPRVILRLICSFLGVYGFSMMYNSTRRMCLLAGLIGMTANTLRLELVDMAHMPAPAAALTGAFTAGMLAALVCHKFVNLPRISLSIPAIVIMVPGMYMYKAIYYFGIGESTTGLGWLSGAALIVLALPTGLILARILTDHRFRVCG